MQEYIVITPRPLVYEVLCTSRLTLNCIYQLISLTLALYMKGTIDTSKLNTHYIHLESPIISYYKGLYMAQL